MSASQPPHRPDGGQPGSAPRYGPPGYGPPQYGPPGYGPGPYGQPGYGQFPAAGAAPYGRPPGGGAGFSLDLGRLRPFDLAVAGGSLLFLVLGLLPWWRLGDDASGVTFSGFDEGMVVSAAVLFVLAAVWALLPGFVRSAVDFPRSSLTVGLAALGSALALFAWLDTLRYAFSLPALLGVLTAGAITVVAGLALRRELRERLPRPAPGSGHWPGPTGPGQVPPYPYPYPYPPPGGGVPPHNPAGGPGGGTVPGNPWHAGPARDVRGTWQGPTAGGPTVPGADPGGDRPHSGA